MSTENIKEAVREKVWASGSTRGPGAKFLLRHGSASRGLS